MIKSAMKILRELRDCFSPENSVGILEEWQAENRNEFREECIKAIENIGKAREKKQ